MGPKRRSSSFKKCQLQEHPSISCGFYYAYKNNLIDKTLRKKCEEVLGLKSQNGGTHTWAQGPIRSNYWTLIVHRVRSPQRFWVIVRSFDSAKINFSTKKQRVPPLRFYSPQNFKYRWTQLPMYGGTAVCLNLETDILLSSAENVNQLCSKILIQELVTLIDKYEHKFVKSFRASLDAKHILYVGEVLCTLSLTNYYDKLPKVGSKEQKIMRKFHNEVVEILEQVVDLSILDARDVLFQYAGFDDLNVPQGDENVPVNSNPELEPKLSVKEELTTSVFDESNFGENEELRQNSTIVNIDAIDLHPEPQPQTSIPAPLESPPESFNTTETTDKRATDASEMITNEFEPVAKKSKLEPINNAITYSFDRPSDSILKRVCKKLKIEYNREAYKLWANISFTKIFATSENIQTHAFKSSNIFTCFSLFFNGNIKKCYSIQDIINSEYHDYLIASNLMSPAEAEQIFTNNTVTNEQLEFISKFLDYRIGIYENGKLKKFGKWDSEEDDDALTLVFSVQDGLYSIVLDL